MRHVLVLAACLLIAGGCATTPGPASPRASVTAPAGSSDGPSAGTPMGSGTAGQTDGTASDAPATESPATDDPTDPPATSPSPTDDTSGRPDPATFLQVCRDLDGATPDPIPCADAVEIALEYPGLAGARVTRVDVRPACEPRRCGRTTAVPLEITVLSDRPPLEVEVARGTDGGLAVGTVRPGKLPTAPAFTPPAPGLATLSGAPASLIARSPYPLCGEETAAMGGPYDRVARRCFLDGVLAGSPVEFASQTNGTEGGGLITVVRFAGNGGIEYVTGEAGQWTRAFTGIRPASGGLVFDVDGMATRSEPVQ
jgi:hypothetical protein